MGEDNKFIGSGIQLFNELAKYNKLLLLLKCSAFFYILPISIDVSSKVLVR